MSRWPSLLLVVLLAGADLASKTLFSRGASYHYPESALLVVLAVVISLGGLAALICYRSGPALAWAICLMTAGSVANTYELVRFGAVRDWLIVGPLTTNLADLLCIAGAIVLAAAMTQAVAVSRLLKWPLVAALVPSLIVSINLLGRGALEHQAKHDCPRHLETQPLASAAKERWFTQQPSGGVRILAAAVVVRQQQICAQLRLSRALASEQRLLLWAEQDDGLPAHDGSPRLVRVAIIEPGHNESALGVYSRFYQGSLLVAVDAQSNRRFSSGRKLYWRWKILTPAKRSYSSR